MASIQDGCAGGTGAEPASSLAITQKKKRGSRACLQCRIRKVRCDVTQNGVPCTNCRIDTQACLIPQRSRKHRLSSASALHALHTGRPESIRPGFTAQDFATQNLSARQREPYLESGLQQSGRGSASPAFEAVPYRDSDGDRWHSSQERRGLEALPRMLNMASARDIPPTTATSSEALNFRPSTSTDPSAASARSAFTAEDAGDGQATAEDLEQHRPLGPKELVVATLPVFVETSATEKAFDDLVRAYFLYVHPHLPLLDEAAFWESYHGPQETSRKGGRLSLLLLQAMLLVACVFVSSSAIQESGFPDVRTARTIYYRRAKALFDLEAEKRVLVRAQGALLMAYHVPLNQPHINTFWLGIAISLARAEGADRYSLNVGMDRPRHNQLKRLWWCCIIRDRMMALGLRRPISIHSASFEKAWPQLTDDDLENEAEQSYVHSPSVKRKLLRSLSSLCKLCTVLTNVLQLLYPADGIRGTGDRLDHLKRIYTYTEELIEWNDSIANDVEVHDKHDQSFRVVVLFSSLLNIYYQSAKAALCNYRILLSLSLSQPVEHSFERLQTKTELQAALRDIAQSLRAIINAEMITYSPIGMVALLALPSVCYNLDISSHVATPKSACVPGANIYQDFLRVLQLRYEGTDRAIENMSRLMTSMGLEDATSPSARGSGSQNRWAGRRESDLHSTTSGSRRTGGGIDIIMSNPQQYVQMSYTLDFFLSRGRMPTKGDNPIDVHLWPGGEEERSPSRGSVGDSVTSELTNVVTASPLFRVEASDLHGRNYGETPLWVASSMDSNGLTGSGDIGTDGAGFSAALTDAPFGKTLADPDGFSFEDFMTDGPASGIGRLQDMLYAYPI